MLLAVIVAFFLGAGTGMIIVSIAYIGRVVQCDNITYSTTVISYDTILGGNFTCQSKATLSSLLPLNATITTYSHDCDKLKTTFKNLTLHGSFDLTNQSVAVLSHSKSSSNYFINGLNGTLTLNTSSEGEAKISICAYSNEVEYDHFLDPSQSIAKLNLTDCQMFEVSNETEKAAIFHSKRAGAGYYFVGIRVISGTLNSLSYNFKTEREVYDRESFKGDQKCTAGPTSPNNCNAISLPYPRTCVMLHVQPNSADNVTISHLSLDGATNLEWKILHDHNILHYSLFALAAVVISAPFVGFFFCVPWKIIQCRKSYRYRPIKSVT